MWPDRVSNLGPLALESDALLTEKKIRNCIYKKKLKTPCLFLPLNNANIFRLAAFLFAFLLRLKGIYVYIVSPS